VSNESLTGKAFALHSKAKKSPKKLDTNSQEIILDKIYFNHYNIILKMDLGIPHITVTFHLPLSSK
jgi:mRNA-degrading endonuclease RelE of RelBE toxin-antitoxin system